MKPGKRDLVLVGALLAVALAGLLLWQLTRKDGYAVSVLVDGVETARYSLSEERQVPIQTGDGQENVLVIGDGTARVTSATCPDGICVSHRPISREGETVVCLPHRLVIAIVAKE